ncbi:D-isomer specific 2-hydroxyacid dehydrogenase NAD-binding [Leptothrix cholodnii SP-6]|uniref:D-isomer specific 2-hydroxyacid dehydrogenase NAD-binding n=1 Tax=Leptothrix cholodnii (strain ATCC 51168 / LMG 8142 / SP-6) TaxID=395495 RepID=B1Y3Z6_LEPCP|nr:2-hydroxyacid dehydrogenase [Leptothrix cholodnii]ACB33390.1 D-isomer specific 2-hydroxyacid dehydrogenase NAD-binding [Leptothrix cholodnii SP-6]
MRTRLINVGRLPPALEARLAQSYDLSTLADQADPAAYLAAHGGEFEALVTSAATGVDAAMLAALPRLRVISNFGVGLDKVDVAAAHARGIAVGYTPDVLNDCVADIAFGLMLDAARGMSAADRFVRRGDWLQGPFPLARKVSGARLGLVGLGRIGRTIAQRSTGFEMPVRYHSRRPVDGVAWVHEPSLLELARWADFLVVITAGGPATRHLVNAEVLDALGPDGFLINVARGSVIDEPALVQALADRRIAGAGLDVFEDEPRVPAALMALDNVVLLPHIASATRETRQAMADRVFDNLQSFFAEGRLVSAAPSA